MSHGNRGGGAGGKKQVGFVFEKQPRRAYRHAVNPEDDEELLKDAEIPQSSSLADWVERVDKRGDPSSRNPVGVLTGKDAFRSLLNKQTENLHRHASLQTRSLLEEQNRRRAILEKQQQQQQQRLNAIKTRSRTRLAPSATSVAASATRRKRRHSQLEDDDDDYEEDKDQDQDDDGSSSSYHPSSSADQEDAQDNNNGSDAYSVKRMSTRSSNKRAKVALLPKTRKTSTVTTRSQSGVHRKSDSFSSSYVDEDTSDAAVAAAGSHRVTGKRKTRSKKHTNGSTAAATAASVREQETTSECTTSSYYPSSDSKLSLRRRRKRQRVAKRRDRSQTTSHDDGDDDDDDEYLAAGGSDSDYVPTEFVYTGKRTNDVSSSSSSSHSDASKENDENRGKNSNQVWVPPASLIDTKTLPRRTQRFNVQETSLYDDEESENYREHDDGGQATTAATTSSSTRSRRKKKIDRNAEMPNGFCYNALNAINMFETLETHKRNEQLESMDQVRIPFVWEIYAKRTYWVRSVSGEHTLKLFIQTLDEFGYERIDQQVIFHQHMINATLPKIFGNELVAHRERILKEYGWDDIMQEVFVVTPRRYGKTWGVAMYAAAALRAIPYLEEVIFSMALRASRKMLALIDKMLNRHEVACKMLKRPHTQEKLTLNGDAAPDDERTCLSYPGKSDVRITAPQKHLPPSPSKKTYKHLYIHGEFCSSVHSSLFQREEKGKEKR